jgi:sporulation protein YhbH
MIGGNHMNTTLPLTIFREYQSSSGQKSDRSAGDRARHRAKVKQSIKDNLGDIIADESLIGKHGDKIIKVPIKGIKEYRFVYGDNSPQAAQGDGSAQPGQVVGKKGGQPQQGKDKGKAGDEKGEDIYETEITLDELKDILFEELQLPNLRKTAKKEIIQKSRAKKDGYRRMGIHVRLDRFKTAKERVKRKKATVRFGGTIEDCNTCGGAGYDVVGALALMLDSNPIDCPDCEGTGKTEKRFRFRKEDQRFKHMEVKPKKQSNAAIIFIMDVSGSMDTEKKFLARSFFNVLYEFIKAKYEKSELVFIAHTAEAEEVDEDRFFHKGSWGGTIASSGLFKGIEIITARYNPSIWNNYVFYMSDGDNSESDNPNCVKAMNELCELSNLVGYGEIKVNSYSGESSMIGLYRDKITNDNYRSVVIKDRNDIWPKLKEFLSIEEAVATALEA